MVELEAPSKTKYNVRKLGILAAARISKLGDMDDFEALTKVLLESCLANFKGDLEDIDIPDGMFLVEQIMEMSNLTEEKLEEMKSFRGKRLGSGSKRTKSSGRTKTQ